MSISKLPILKPEEVIRALERLGFKCTKKSKGSHFRYKHPGGRRTTPCLSTKEKTLVEAF